MPPSIFAISIRRGTFSRTGDHRLLVEFSGSKSGPVAYEWTPHWLTEGQGVADLVREAVRVEKANQPGSNYLSEFAAVARDVLIEHAPPIAVARYSGKFESYQIGEDGAPRVRVRTMSWTGTKWWVEEACSWELGVPFVEEVLRILGHTDEVFDWVIWDRKIVDVQLNGDSLLEKATQLRMARGRP